MHIKVLGSNGYYPSENRHTSCYALPHINAILDAGTGFFRIAEYLDMDQELHILMSHYHDDHTAGLFWLMGLYKGPKVTIYGPAGIESVKKAFGGPSSPFDFDDHPFVIELKQVNKPFSIQDTKIDLLPVPHAHPTLAYRITHNNKSMAYVTDTTADISFAPFLQNLDLLIHECYLKDEFLSTAVAHRHTCPLQLKALLKEISCKQIILSHINPTYSDQGIKALEKAVGFDARAAFDLQNLYI